MPHESSSGIFLQLKKNHHFFIFFGFQDAWSGNTLTSDLLGPPTKNCNEVSGETTPANRRYCEGQCLEKKMPPQEEPFEIFEISKVMDTLTQHDSACSFFVILKDGFFSFLVASPKKEYMQNIWYVCFLFPPHESSSSLCRKLVMKQIGLLQFDFCLSHPLTNHLDLSHMWDGVQSLNKDVTEFILWSIQFSEASPPGTSLLN